MRIQTVTGPIRPDELGFTQPHEHLLIDHYNVQHKYDAILDDEGLAVEELLAFKRAGGDAIADPTNLGIGRNPLALRRISQAAGVKVIMGSGWYREAAYPQYVWEKSANELADVIIRDVREGADGTDVRAGFIGEIGTERHYITPVQERVFRAAARAHLQTGALILTHTTHWGDLAREQLALLKEEGVDLRRVAISHVGDRRGVHDLLPLVETGATLVMDHVGFLEVQRDEQRAANAVELIRAGYREQLLIASDVCFLSHLHWYGGRGYDHVIRRFLPLLREAGAVEEDLHAIFVDNPRRLFAF